jgi:hypothetical protein
VTTEKELVELAFKESVMNRKSKNLKELRGKIVF